MDLPRQEVLVKQGVSLSAALLSFAQLCNF